MANHKEATLPRNKLVHDKCRPCVLPLYCTVNKSSQIMFFSFATMNDVNINI